MRGFKTAEATNEQRTIKIEALQGIVSNKTLRIPKEKHRKRKQKWGTHIKPHIQQNNFV
jgi:hypothetical protein